MLHSIPQNGTNVLTPQVSPASIQQIKEGIKRCQDSITMCEKVMEWNKEDPDKCAWWESELLFWQESLAHWQSQETVYPPPAIDLVTFSEMDSSLNLPDMEDDHPCQCGDTGICPHCEGKTYPADPCSDCHGTGYCPYCTPPRDAFGVPYNQEKAA